MPEVRLLFLGPPRVECEGQPVEFDRRKALALLCYLAVSGPFCSRESLSAMLWPEHDEERARAQLRQILASLNKTPVGQWIEADRDTVSLRQDGSFWIDAVRFNDLIDSEPTVEALSEAVELYRGGFMTGFTLKDSAEFDNWQSLQMQVFQQKLVGALEQLVDLQMAAQDTEKAIRSVQRWLMIDVLHEPAQRQFMRLCAATGQRAAALRQYEMYVDLLRRELDAAPSAEMVELYEAIRNDEPIPLQEQPVSSRSVLPPLPRMLIGREGALAELKHRLGKSEQRAIIVQGWPGIGKTSVVSALAHDTDLREWFPDGVLFAALGEQPNIFLELANWARVLGLGNVDRFASVDVLSRQLAAALYERQVLLIVDDVWETTHAQPFMIGGRGCAVVLTTRMNDVARSLADRPENVYKLPILAEADSMALLRRVAPQVVEQAPAESLELVRSLEGLPLALQVAGRLLCAEISMGWGIEDLLQELRDGVRLLDERVPADATSFHQEAPPTVRVLLKRSTDRLDDEMRRRFALLGAFAPKPATFDLAAIQAVWQVPDPKSAVRMLVGRGLLEPVGSGQFQIHALLVTHARSMFTE